jgi:hypothetical protein
MAYVATGALDTRCGWPILFSAAQRLSEVHVVTGAVRVVLARGGRAAGRDDRGAGNCWTTLVFDQFNEVVSSAMTGGDEMVSSGTVGVVAHPAKRIAVPTMMPAGLNTRSLCGC